MADRRQVEDRHVISFDAGRLTVAVLGGGLVLVLVFLLGVFVGRSLWAPRPLPPELEVSERPAPRPTSSPPQEEPLPQPELSFYRDLKSPSAQSARQAPVAPRAETPPAPPPPAPPRTSAAEAPPPVFTVQVGSFRSRADAERFLARIRQQGVEAQIVEASVAGRTWYRVQAGRFRSRAAAGKFQDSVLKGKGIQGFVTTR